MHWWLNKEQICRDNNLVLYRTKDKSTNNLWINLFDINAKINSALFVCREFLFACVPQTVPMNHRDVITEIKRHLLCADLCQES